MAQNVFYKELDNALEVLQGVTGIADDNFVYGSTEKENDESLSQLQERARAERIKFSADNLQLKFIEFLRPHPYTRRCQPGQQDSGTHTCHDTS